MKKFLLIIITVLTSQLPLNGQNTGHAGKIIYLKDGSKIIGQIVSVKTGEHITLKLNGGELLKVYAENIKKIKSANNNYHKVGLPKSTGEIIFLKDGGHLFGNITEQVPGDYVTIQLKNGKEVSFFDEEIAQIKYNRKPKKPPLATKKGYYHETDIGVALGREDFFNVTVGNFSIHTVNGYRFSPRLHTGLGVGFDFQPEFRLVPIYLNIGGEIGKSRVVPVYFVNMGYNYANERFNLDIGPNSSDIRGGKYAHVGGGLKVKLHRMALQMKLGYKINEIIAEQNFIDWSGRDGGSATTKRQIRRLAFTVGFSF